MAPDLGLDLKLSTSKFITSSPKEESSPIQDDGDKKIAKLEESIRRFEQERQKIEVFKRELPLCMFLLDDVINRLKRELEHCNALEEFMAVKSKLDEKRGAETEKDCREKMVNWMSSAQLWSDNCSDDNNNNKNRPVDATGTAAPRGIQVKSPTSSHVSIQPCGRASRKARRCWSPELHRHFIAVLQQLGGAQVATPKQIRERMKVDGLTNDEVKSHLQKYRLHSREEPNSWTLSEPVVVMGGACRAGK